MAIAAIIPTALSLLGDEPPASSGICGWIAGKLRMVEQLSHDWKNKDIEGSNVSWLTIIKDIAQIFIGIVSAILVSIPTFGTAIPCLINESQKQAKHDAHHKARAALQHQANAHHEELGQHQMAHDTLNGAHEDLKKRIQDTASRHDILNNSHEQLKNELAILKAENDHLKNQVHHHDLTHTLGKPFHTAKDLITGHQSIDDTNISTTTETKSGEPEEPEETLLHKITHAPQHLFEKVKGHAHDTEETKDNITTSKTSSTKKDKFHKTSDSKKKDKKEKAHKSNSGSHSH